MIVVTGDNDRANAVKAIGLGAYDFYQKPADPEILNLIVERAYRVYELEIENRRLSQNQDKMPLSIFLFPNNSLNKLIYNPQLLGCRKLHKCY